MNAPSWIIDDVLGRDIIDWKVSQTLVEKLLNIERDVQALITQEDDDSIADWRDKLMDLWARITDANDTCNQTFSDTASLTESETTITSATSQSNKTTVVNGSSTSDGLFELKLSKAQLENPSFLKDLSLRMTIKMMNQLNGQTGQPAADEDTQMKDFIEQLAFIIQLISTMPNRIEHEHFLLQEYIQPRLPENLRDQFLDRCDRKIFQKTLSDLKLFFVDNFVFDNSFAAPTDTNDLCDETLVSESVMPIIEESTSSSVAAQVPTDAWQSKVAAYLQIPVQKCIATNGTSEDVSIF